MRLFMIFMVCALSSGPAWAEPSDEAQYRAAIVKFEKGLFPSAAKILVPLSNKGYAPAQTRMGFMLQRGLGGYPASQTKALALYRAAAQGGDVEANYFLSIMAFHGQGGLVKSSTEALRLMKLAADAGLPQAKAGLAELRALVKKEGTEQARKTTQPQPDWLIGRWGQAEPDEAGGLRDHSGTFHRSCSDKGNRGFATIGYVGNSMMLDIIHLGTAGFMGGFSLNKPADYSIPDNAHANIYPLEWGGSWLEVEKREPGVLFVHQHMVKAGEEDEKYWLKICE
ncbi:MAG: hypothetical protein COA47_01245 [Robiginitomaculum sp.]|nr:MAG: hypothetical protein COA47_01245 [Robiginitomaculum sp.]